jgi:CheY-like chemotaxis protein
VSKRVLVVDDDRAMVQTLCDILRHRGWEAEGVFSGEAALASQQAEQWPVVLMDIRMPGIDGVEACRAMMTMASPPRVILMTAQAESSRLRDASRQGAWRVLHKPLNLPELLELLG